jgi:hypothetical protein
MYDERSVCIAARALTGPLVAGGEARFSLF